MTAVSQSRAEHARWHRFYVEHLEHCVRACLVGGQCERAREILANADAAGERWRLASERAGRAPVAAMQITAPARRRGLIEHAPITITGGEPAADRQADMAQASRAGAENAVFDAHPFKGASGTPGSTAVLVDAPRGCRFPTTNSSPR